MSMVWRKLTRKMRSKHAVITLISGFVIFLIVYSIGGGNHKHKKERRSYKSDDLEALIEPDETMVRHVDLVPTDLTDSPNRTHINPYPFKFTMLPTGCTDEKLVIIVHSAVQYHKRRMLCRNTWLDIRNLERELSMKIKIVFVTGATLDGNATTYLHYEQEMYGDIVQSDFIDDYQNNTYKAISFLRWVASPMGCPNASLILKVDDDALVHPVRLTKLNNTIHKALATGNPDVYLGRLLTQEVNRNNESKWYVSYDVYPHKLYPVWMQGLVYILTPHLASKLYPIALDTKYMFTDDVYMGVLVSQVKGADVLVQNVIGAHTEGKIANWEGAFRQEGRIFYHVPSFEHFYKWFNLERKYVSLDALRPTSSPKSTGRGIFLVFCFIIIPLLLVASIVICVVCSEGSHNSSSPW